MYTGTLEELDVKPGDVVECVDAQRMGDYYTAGRTYTVGGHDDDGHDVRPGEESGLFRIISRASDLTESSVQPVSDKPKTWGEMSDVEKGALMLAHLKGKVIQMEWADGFWMDRPKPRWDQDVPYRIKPNPKVETENLDVFYNHGGGVRVMSGSDWPATHRITFTTTDGEPDLKSIKMEKV